MKCPECNHDNISVVVGDNNKIVVQCSNCGLNISVEDSPLLSVFLYNYDAEQRQVEGRMAFLEGIPLCDCPYDDDYRTVWSRGLWINGWQSERENMKGASFLLSAKKEKEEEGDLHREKIAYLYDKLREQNDKIRLMNNAVVQLLGGMKIIRDKRYWRVSSCQKAIRNMVEGYTGKYRKILQDFPD